MLECAQTFSHNKYFSTIAKIYNTEIFIYHYFPQTANSPGENPSIRSIPCNSHTSTTNASQNFDVELARSFVCKSTIYGALEHGSEMLHLKSAIKGCHL